MTRLSRIFLPLLLCSFLLPVLLAWGAAGSQLGTAAPPRKKSDEKIHLIHADHLRYDEYRHPGAQLLSGDVRLTHENLRMFCDSAVVYEATNSFEAFGQVRLLQDDTLSLTGDYLFYDGESQIAQMRRNVCMKHRNSTLLTDSLNYDRLYSVGYFFKGGKLIDGNSTLTSDWGEYYTSTRKSMFNYNVKLENPKFTLTSDTLHYDLFTKWAHVLGPSNVLSGENRIYTEDGYYNTATDRARLLGRPVLFNQGRRLTGDSLFYDKVTGVMNAYENIVYEDFENKNILTGDFGTYNELTGEALATKKALARDYSQGTDTLYVHADTLRLYTYNIDTDSMYRVLHGYFHARAYRADVQAVCDSLVFNSRERKLTLYRDPIVWSDNRQILGEEINVFVNDSTVDSVYVERQALLVEQMDTVHFNQVAGHVMKSYYRGGEMKENRVEGNVYVVQYPVERDSVILYQNYTETTELRMYMENRKLSKMWTPAAENTLYPVGAAPKEKTFLSNFAWFDYIRPLNKDDLFEWRPKKAGTELKASIRREAPVQTLDKLKKK